MALTNAKVLNNLDFHMRNIISNFMGQTVNHIKATKTLDDNGLITDESSVEADIIVMIGTVNADVVNENIGIVQYGDLLMYAMSDEGVLVGDQTTDNTVRYDRIEYQSVLYSVTQKLKTAYDAGVPDTAVVDKLVLRKIAYQ